MVGFCVGEHKHSSIGRCCQSWSVRHHQDAAGVSELCDGTCYHPLGRPIEPRCRFIDGYEGNVSDEDSGKSNPLPLSDRQALTRLTQHRVDSVWEISNEVRPG
jgi:hypothetical protein